MVERTNTIDIEADFQRSIYSILGLPFDALKMHEVVKLVYDSIDKQHSCFISTPNLNFLIGTQADPVFRQSVIDSDLSLADGMPLIWIARFLGIPIKERLAGSGLIEKLKDSEQRVQKPVKVFFFGGMEGVADLACTEIEKKNCGITCAGSMNPGFGSVEEMSNPEIITRINQSGAEFIIVSLGAKKGQQWIERNRHKLEAQVISHLGAVVNFLAGRIERAPLSWQRFGMEWLWRIKEEPVLWKRYVSDGLSFIMLLCTRVFPYAFLIHSSQLLSVSSSCSITVNESEDVKTIKITGAPTSEKLTELRSLFANLAVGDGRICIDLDDTTYCDPSFCGLLLILYKHAGDRLTLATSSRLIRKVLRYNGIDFLIR